MFRYYAILITLALCSAVIANNGRAISSHVSWTFISLNGVKLEMSSEQVLRLWGEPHEKRTKSRKTRSGENLSIVEWRWEQEQDAFVDFDETGRVVMLGADGRLRIDQEVVDGLYKTSPVSLISLLSKPALVVSDSSDFTDSDWVYRGPSDLELIFEMGGRQGVFYTVLGHSRYFIPGYESTQW